MCAKSIRHGHPSTLHLWWARRPLAACRAVIFTSLVDDPDDPNAQHEAGQLLSIAFLKALLALARDVVNAEEDIPQEEDEDRGLAALTAFFEEVRNAETPISVERVVEDIDEIVRLVRFDGWQATSAGEREVRKALRKTLFKYKLHQDKELFEKAYGYVREYY